MRAFRPGAKRPRARPCSERRLSLAVLLYFSAQRFQKLLDQRLVGGRSRATELIAEHHVDCVVERLGRAVVEVRRGQFDVAKAGDLEYEAVRGPFGDVEAAQVRFGDVS